MSGAPNIEVVVLRAGPVPYWPEEILAAIADFAPLPIEAGEKAAEWLRRIAGSPAVPIDVFLLLDKATGQLLGFFAIEQETVVISSGDAPVVQVRTGIPDPTEEQPASLLVCMARSRFTESGFGDLLFDVVVADALDRGSRIIRVAPADLETQRRIWQGRFHFRAPRENRDSGWVFLWYGIGSPDQTFG